MTLSIYMKGDYEELHTFRRRKNKPNSKPNKANLGERQKALELYLLIMIYYFSVTSVLSVAQTTVLISVNPCLTERNLKKQSQFIMVQRSAFRVLRKESQGQRLKQE